MNRVLLAALAATFVMFFVGFLWWAALPTGDMAMSELGDSEAEFIASVTPLDPGVYYYPTPPDMSDEAAVAAYTTAHERGPIGMLFVSTGRPVMSASTFAYGLLHYFVSALLICVLMFRSGPSEKYLCRFLFVLIGGSAGALLSDLSGPIWFHLDPGYHFNTLASHVVSWAAAGLVIAAILKPADVPQTV